MRVLITIFAMVITCSHALGAELRVSPEAAVVSPANGRGYYDFVIHNIMFATVKKERATVDRFEIEILKDGTVLETRIVPAKDLAASTLNLTSSGIVDAVGAQVLNPDGVSGVFNRPVALTGEAMLEPSQAIIATGLYFAVSFLPDDVRITAYYKPAYSRALRRKTVNAQISEYKSPISYRAPLTGIWTQQAIPTISSHHRLNAPTEFAVDFFKMNEAGEIYDGDMLKAENAYGYGAPVLAAADGVVVSVIDDEKQDRSVFARAEGESPQEAGARIGAYMQAKFNADFRRAAGGNIIILRHEKGDVAEYSAYGHLKTASARVNVGEEVRQGDVIAEVGDTGDSPAVHLHFQVNSGEDPFMSKSLPVRFENLRQAAGNNELGRIVILSE